MFDLGWSEILVIAIVLIVVVGPKDLPRVLRSFGRTTTKLRAMAGDFRRQFDDALREAELDDVKNLVDDVRKLDPRNELRKHLNPLEQAGRDIKSDLDKASKATTAVASEPSKASDTAPTQPATIETALDPVAKSAKLKPVKVAASKPAAKKAPALHKTVAAPKPVAATKPVTAAKKAPTKKDDAAVKPKPVRSKKNTGSDAQ